MGEKENLIKEYEDLCRKGMELKKRLKRWYMRGPSSVIEIWQTKQGLIEIIHRMDEIYEMLGMSKKFSYF
jgi:hypothetical protein